MATVTQAASQFRDMWSNLSTGKKISFIVIFAVMAGAFAALMWWTGRPEYRILYTDLAAEDASAVTTRLKDMKVQYQLSRGGTAVSVPVEAYYEARMALANAGLPTGGAVGFELFDRKNVGLSDFQVKVAYLRALQGELSRTIQQIKSVEAVRVHLAVPEKSLFVEQQRDATASIILKLAANARLNDEQVQGIVFLVSSSVEGLDPKNVTIIDDKGHVLSKRQDESSGGSIAGDAYKMERQMEEQIVGLIARSVGPEKVAAKVSVLLDNQQVQKVVEEYNPDGQVVRSEQVVTSSDQGSETDTAGMPGAETNVPEGGAAPAEGHSQTSRGEKRQETINYEISRSTSTITQTGGTIKQLSIAVLIDGTYQEVKGPDGKTTKKFTPRTEQEMTTFTELIKKAVGFNKDRGDQIEVATVPFLTDGLGEEGLGGDKMDLYSRILNYVLAGLAGLLFLLFVVRPLVRWLTSEPSLEQQLGLPPGLLQGSTVGELEAHMQRPGLPAATEPGTAPETDIQDRLKKLDQQRANVLESASRDQAAVTLMVRRWLKEEEGSTHAG